MGAKSNSQSRPQQKQVFSDISQIISQKKKKQGKQGGVVNSTSNLGGPKKPPTNPIKENSHPKEPQPSGEKPQRTNSQ